VKALLSNLELYEEKVNTISMDASEGLEQLEGWYYTHAMAGESIRKEAKYDELDAKRAHVRNAETSQIRLATKQYEFNQSILIHRIEVDKMQPGRAQDSARLNLVEYEAQGKKRFEAAQAGSKLRLERIAVLHEKKNRLKKDVFDQTKRKAGILLLDKEISELEGRDWDKEFENDAHTVGGYKRWANEQRLIREDRADNEKKKNDFRIELKGGAVVELDGTCGDAFLGVVTRAKNNGSEIRAESPPERRRSPPRASPAAEDEAAKESMKGKRVGGALGRASMLQEEIRIELVKRDISVYDFSQCIHPEKVSAKALMSTETYQVNAAGLKQKDTDAALVAVERKYKDQLRRLGDAVTVQELRKGLSELLDIRVTVEDIIEIFELQSEKEKIDYPDMRYRFRIDKEPPSKDTALDEFGQTKSYIPFTGPPDSVDVRWRSVAFGRSESPRPSMRNEHGFKHSNDPRAMHASKHVGPPGAFMV